MAATPHTPTRGKECNQGNKTRKRHVQLKIKIRNKELLFCFLKKSLRAQAENRRGRGGGRNVKDVAASFFPFLF